jgi:hypothetical protein
LRFRFWESLLLVLCKFFAFLASSLQVLCKFLAKSLQEFSAGGGKRGKVDPITAPKPIQNGANLAHGGRQGIPENQQKYEQIKNANANTRMRQKHIFLYVRRFPKNTEGSTAGRLQMIFEKRKVIKCCIKQSTNKRNKN